MSRRRTLRNLARGLLFVSPFIVGFSVFTIYPVCASFWYSFTDFGIFTPPRFIGLGNYRELIADPVFWLSMWNTIYYTLIAVPAGIISAFLLALLLNSKVRGMAYFRTLFFLPSIMPAVAGSVLWYWMFNYEYGVLNSLLRPVCAVLTSVTGREILPPGWLVDPVWAKPALILMGLWGVGGSTILYLAGLQDVPQTLYEAAEIDGATPLRKTWHITLPAMSPIIFFTFIMGVIGSFQVFTQAFIITQGGPAGSTLFYALYLFNNAFLYFRLGYASAMAWILFVIVLGATMLIFKGTGRFVHYEGKA